jgi:hypothetical protein
MKWRSVILALAMLVLAVPVQAAPIEREHYSESFSGDFDDCGFWIHEEVTFEGVFMLKAPRGDGTPPYLFDNYESHQVLTANGRTAYIDHQGLYADVKIRLVEGTVYQFIAHEVGQPWVMRDEDGNVLVRDRGSLRVTFQVDTLGDSDLDNDIFIEDSWELVRDSGRHPAFYFDFCEVMTQYFFG